MLYEENNICSIFGRDYIFCSSGHTNGRREGSDERDCGNRKYN